MNLTWEQLLTLLNTAKVLHNGREAYSFSGVANG
uniref:Uncharacterized protein n=3 Tax=unclassified bacterial viruses TaxID=12333 RepID=A0AAU6W3Y3_9VIRU